MAVSLRYFLICLWLGALAACASSPLPTSPNPAHQTASAGWPAKLEFTDGELQRAASAALGQREGAMVVLDAQTGRIRALVNPRLALAQAFPPGSTIKPFTALTALRARTVERGTARQCRGRYARDGYETICSHPHSQTPFNLPQALAYSCNDYFGQLGERLNASAVQATLRSFGFGQRTGGNLAGEIDGQLLLHEWRAQEALGDSDSLLVTPLQLALAYSALFNGGRLYVPQQTETAAGTGQLKRRLGIAPEARAVLLEGLRGAVKYGSAEKAQLAQAPFYVFGKTGTSGASNGFQTQGWFVGLLADRNGQALPAPEAVNLTFVVLLKRAHGSQGAEVLRNCLAQLASSPAPSAAPTATFLADAQRQTVGGGPRLPARVRVRAVSAQRTLDLPFEAYVAGVVAAEASVETQPEALKAQAVVSRTYALQNLGRHARAGFDFCSTTHCQRFWPPATTAPRRVVQHAVTQTSGVVLQDAQGQVAECYFHAACGGHTAHLELLWGKRAPAHLRGVSDEFCAVRPNRNWQVTLSATQLAQALRRDSRTDVGANLQRIEVLQRDANGRALRLALYGNSVKEVSGWDFKLAVGRALGWQWLKSSWFDVRRSGAQFLFSGHGFGHGLGLCQEGAHVMAERGFTAAQILEFYFPGAVSAQLRQPLQLQPASFPQSTASRTTLASEHFRVVYPASLTTREVEPLLQELERNRRIVLQQLAEAALVWREATPTEIVIHATTADFIAATGAAGWVAAVTRGARIELQPPALLRKRGILTTTLKHELIHVVSESLSKGRAPRWLAEGLALNLAGEGRAFARIPVAPALSLVTLEQRLQQPAPRQETQQLYAQAYREVQRLIRLKGVAYVWQRVAAKQ